MAKDRYEHGTICSIHYPPGKRPNCLSDIDENTKLVYIDRYASFNTYVCYPCNENGNVKEDAPIHYIHKSYLIKYTYLPTISNGDMQALLNTLEVFDKILSEKEVDMIDILKSADKLSLLAHKLALIKTMEGLK